MALPDPNKCVAYAVLVLAAIMYGGWAIVSKATMGSGAAAWIFIFYRCLGGAIVLILMCLLMPSMLPEKKGGVPMSLYEVISGIPRKESLRFAMLGATQLGTAVGFIIASGHVSAIMVSVFQPTIPVFTALIGSVLGTEQFSVLKILSIVCAVGGAIIVVTFGEAKPAGAERDLSELALGTAYLVLSVVSTAVYFILQKDMMKTYPPVINTTLAYVWSTIISLPVALALHGFDYAAWSFNGSTIAWAGIAYTSALASAWCLLAWANKQTSPTTAAASSTIQPIAAAILSWIFLEKMLTAGQAAGGLTIIAGLFLFIKAQTDMAAQDEAKALIQKQQEPAVAKV